MISILLCVVYVDLGEVAGTHLITLAAINVYEVT